ncbi:class I SAM-dependent methyltransferase [Xanthomonas citri pv. glycines]|uniref:class I SAM-dependent methyltransferase n=1 Tax=Xanthomonas citri TaxID=346 RepID=UPI0011867E94|nr:class I SAM-dependent methyltransferase [Xanthomonas citri]QDS05523.1 class I SAM-dependent methyltransferase [Xanthomonas citri pv. glycines]TSJ93390.1 class I SAM-dependent methyltransferase [Xanthomonas citri pv. glycines]
MRNAPPTVQELWTPDHGHCRCCGGTQAQRTVWAEVYVGTGQELRRCGACAAVYLAPDLTEAALQHFYAHDYRRLFPAEIPWGSQRRFFAWRGDRWIAHNRLQRIAPALAPAARVLEVGSGFGAFLGAAAATRPDLRLSACEPDVTHRHVLLDGAAVTFLPALDTLADGEFEAVVAFHVLEHLTDPRAFLSSLARILVPEGQAWIEVPDLMSGWRSRNYVHPAHLSYFSAPLLRRLANAAGLEVVSCGPYSDRGVLAGNIWLHLRQPAQPHAAASLALADSHEVDAVDARLDMVRWSRRDRLQRRLKHGLIRVLGRGLFGELQRWRGYRQLRRDQVHDGLR